jgi:hypothetical protein
MREFINKHGKIIAGVGIGLAILLGFVLTRRSGPNPRANPSYGFFIDEETGDESVHLLATVVPPLQGKNGKPTVVRVVKFTCDAGKTVQVGYYMKYPPDVHAALTGMAEDDARRADLLEMGQIVRPPQSGSQWIRSQSEAGQKLMQSMVCPSGEPRLVHPEI